MPDHSTVVSVVPFQIREVKPGLFPSVYQLKASVNNEPVCLVVEAAYFHVPVPDHPQGSFKIETNSRRLARSIVEDFQESQLARSVEDEAEPGLFWVEGAYSPEEVKNKLSTGLEEAKYRQKRWFLALVRMADDDFEKAHRHEVVSDVQRHAARALNLEREWLMDVASVQMLAKKTCPVCTSQVLAQAIICPTCRAILDEQAAKKFSFAA